jgi:hypothetical protein
MVQIGLNWREPDGRAYTARVESSHVSAITEVREITQDADKIHIPPPRKVSSNGCSKCSKSKAKIHQWLGIRWIGVPKPIRWYRAMLNKDKPKGGYTGCGCILKLKVSWDAVIIAMKSIWDATKVAWRA